MARKIPDRPLGRLNRPDVIRGHHDVVVPDLEAVAGGFLSVDVEPDVIDVEFLDRAPAEALEESAAFGNLEAHRRGFFMIPANPAALAGRELVMGFGIARRTRCARARSRPATDLITGW